MSIWLLVAMVLFVIAQQIFNAQTAGTEISYYPEFWEAVENNLIEGSFHYGNKAAGIPIAEILPAEKGDSRIIRAVFPREKGVKHARAVVIFLEKEYELKTEIKEE